MSGIFVPWLPAAARLTGYPVVEVADWRTRGVRGLAAVEVVVCHHTAGPKTGEAPSLAIVRDGRAGLSGPLSQLVLGRSGAVYVVAAGVANHAGVSSWAGMSDLNSRSLGIEAEDDGDGRWTAEQLDCYPRLVAALLHYMRRPADRAAGHREVALPAGRKVDPAGIDMPAFRRQVAHLLTDPLRLIPRGGPTTTGGSMASVRDEVWQGPIDDLLRAGQRPQAWQHLQRASAYAERAMNAAEAAAAAADRVEARLVGLQSPDSDVDVDRVRKIVRTVLGEALADVLRDVGPLRLTVGGDAPQ